MYSGYEGCGIRFDDCFFSEPRRLAEWRTPRYPGIFAVVACDPSWAPRPFRVLCFGQFGNDSANPLEWCGYGWMTTEENRNGLYVAVLPMPFSTSSQRATLVRGLVAGYHPAYQREMPPREAESASRRRRIGFLPELAPAVGRTSIGS